MLYLRGWSGLIFRIYPTDLKTGHDAIHSLNFSTRSVSHIISVSRGQLRWSGTLCYKIKDFMIFFIVFIHLPLLIKMYKTI